MEQSILKYVPSSKLGAVRDAYHVRIESRAMSYKAALDNQRLALLPVFD